MSVGKQRRVLDSPVEHTSIYKVRRRENAFKETEKQQPAR